MASFTTREYNDIGKEARLALKKEHLSSMLPFMKDKLPLTQLVTEVLKAFQIAELDFDNGNGARYGSAGAHHRSTPLASVSENAAVIARGHGQTCLPGWSLLDLVHREKPSSIGDPLDEDVHMQPVAFKLLSALASALQFPGAFKDTHRSASQLTGPAAKPDSVLITPAWTEPTWSVLVASFEFQLQTIQTELDIMLGQLVQGCMAALKYQAHRKYVFGVGLTMDAIEVFRFQRYDYHEGMQISSTGLLPFSVHQSSEGFQALASLLSCSLDELGVVAQTLPEDIRLRTPETRSEWSLDHYNLQLLHISSRQPHDSYVYWLRNPTGAGIAGGTSAGSSTTVADAVLKLSDTAKEADILLEAHKDGPMRNVVQLVASGSCTLFDNRFTAMVIQPFARRLTQTDACDVFAAVACDVALAIGELWKRNILHRDITPNNIGYVDDSGKYRGILFDFSVATTVTQEEETHKPDAACLYFLGKITGTLAWAPYSVLLGESHSVSSQLEGLFISLHSVAMGQLGRPRYQTRKGTVQAWAGVRLEQFATLTPPFMESIPDGLRPLIAQLHSLFWPLPDGAWLRTYNPDVTVEQFVNAVRCATGSAEAGL